MRRAGGLLVAVVFFLLAPLPARAQVPLVVDATLNSEARGAILLLEDARGLLLGSDELRAWRLLVPPSADLQFQRRSYYRFERLGIEVVEFDRAALRIELRASPAAFEASVLPLAELELRATPAALGGFFNYDLVGTRDAQRAALNGAFELGAFSRIGVLAHQFVARNLWRDDGEPRQYERIATALRRDWSETLLTLELGDAISRAGATGRALRFGGAQLRTNFGLRPGFVQQPLPTLTGQAALPSTVEVFVQNQLRSITNVPAGPFTLDRVPVVLGAGDARVVVRDALGREHVMTTSFYAASGLLREGLADFSASAGRLRTAGALDGRQYGNDFASGLLRYGVHRNLTLEARAEYEAGATRVAAAALDAGSRFGEGEVAAAIAQTPTRTRRFVALGYRYQDVDRSIRARIELAQPGLRFAGDTEESPTPRRLTTVNGSQRFTERWTASATWIDSQRADGTRTRSASVAVFAGIGAGASVLMTLNRVEDERGRRNLVGAFVTFPLGPRTSFNAGVEGGALPRRTATLQQALPIDEGWGYRVAATEARGNNRGNAWAALQLPAATLVAEAAKVQNQPVAVRLGASGSVAAIDGVAFAARAIVDSFALIRIPEVTDVPVLLNNQAAGRTDARGNLVLPRLSSYLPSVVRVDPDELPPDVEIRRDRETVVPPYRSGVRVELDVRRTSAALVRVVGAAGIVIPRGAVVRIGPDATASGVAQRGEFFVSGAAGSKRATIEWRGQSCSIEFELPAARPPRGGAFHQLGPFACGISAAP